MRSLAAKNRELALLYDSAAFLQTPLPIEWLCQGFIERLSVYFKADAASVRMLDPVRGNLHMVAHSGLSEELVAGEQCLKVGECLCGEAVERREAAVHFLKRIEGGQQLRCQREGFATVSVFHIEAREQHIGFFNLQFRTERAFTAHEHALLGTLGHLLGFAIENQRLNARAREMAVSEERNLVAQGLHDSIAQGLNFLNLQAQMLESSINAGRLDEAAALVPALRSGVKESYEDVRELLHNFRNRLAEESLVEALRATALKFEHNTGIAVDFKADQDGAPITREQQLQILFVAQEALSNVRKHAMATRVDFIIEDGKAFTMTIRDNGAGFDPSVNSGGGHVGLVIMAERAARIGAAFAVRSGKGEGTALSIVLKHPARRIA
ncbi:MAG: histidine kinase [Pseudomonadota bacterium]